MTDSFTDELFASEELGALSVVYSISRLVVDPERFLDDEKEMMAARGKGVIYTRTSDGRPLRDPPAQEERTALLTRYYHPHHSLLAQEK